MKTLTQEQIKEIAGELETGFRVFVHKTSGEMVSIPDEDQFDDIEMDVWEEQFELLENNAADYIEIEKWASHEAFEWMAAFAEQCTENPELQNRLIRALNRKGPFREFKFVIDNAGEYRQKWFSFKDEQIHKWVLDSVNQSNESGE